MTVLVLLVLLDIWKVRDRPAVAVAGSVTTKEAELGLHAMTLSVAVTEYVLVTEVKFAGPEPEPDVVAKSFKLCQVPFEFKRCTVLPAASVICERPLMVCPDTVT